MLGALLGRLFALAPAACLLGRLWDRGRLSLRHLVAHRRPREHGLGDTLGRRTHNDRIGKGNGTTTERQEIAGALPVLVLVRVLILTLAIVLVWMGV